MGVWVIGADVLARSRFAVSPLAETVAALGALSGWETGSIQRQWASPLVPRYRELLADDPVTAALVDAACRPTWTADFFTTPPHPTDRTIHDELGRIRQTPDAVAQADLEYALGGTLPGPLRTRGLAKRAADLLEWVWTHAVRPDWTRRRGLLEADIVARTQRLSSGGWAAALDELRPGLRWLGDGRLQINAYDNPPRELNNAQLWFVPTTATGGRVDWDEPEQYAVTYPCNGLLVDGHRSAGHQPLGALLGAARASILQQLESPKSTSHLVAITGYSLGSVGGHLKILLDAGLARRRQSGRSVLYYRTPTGDQLVEIQAQR